MDAVESDTDLAETHLTESLEDAVRDEDREAIRAVTRNETRVLEDRRHRPVTVDEPIHVDGVVYRLDATVVDSREVPRLDIGIDYDPGETDATTRTVRLEELPERDRELLTEWIDPDDHRRVDGYDANWTTPYENPERSTLLDGPLLVEYEGERYRVAATRRGTVTFEDYRYTAERVATTAAYGERVREAHEFRLDGLSTNETEILESAREETYYPESVDDTGFQSLVDRFTARDGDAVRYDGDIGTWIARWRGETYWVSLRVGEFDTAE